MARASVSGAEVAGPQCVGGLVFAVVCELAHLGEDRGSLLLVHVIGGRGDHCPLPSI